MENGMEKKMKMYMMMIYIKYFHFEIISSIKRIRIKQIKNIFKIFINKNIS